jgi:hypothetical protein
VTVLSSACPPPSHPDQTYGIEIAIEYEINDQDGFPINLQQSDIYTPWEIVNSCTTGGGQTLCGSGSGPIIAGCFPYAGNNGQFTDTPLGKCVNLSFTGYIDQEINIVINGTFGGPTIRSNSFALASSASGHGSITNGTDISASQ